MLAIPFSPKTFLDKAVIFVFSVAEMHLQDVLK